MGGQQIAVANPVQPLEFPDGRGTRPVPAKRGEVVQAQQISRRISHRLGIQRTRPRGHEPALLRIHTVAGRRQPVGVMAAQCREAGVESGRRPGHVADPDILRKKPSESTDQCGELGLTLAWVTWMSQGQRIGGDVHMGHLTGGVDAAVGSSGTEDPDRKPENRRQRIFDDAGDGPVTNLHRPAGEIRTVVGDIKPEPYRLRTRQ